MCWGTKKGGEVTDSSRSVVNLGDDMAHQYAGTDGSVVVPQALSDPGREQSRIDPVGQHHNLCLYQQERRHKVSDSVQDSSETLVMVPGEKYCSPSCPCSGGRQCPCGFLVSPKDRPQGVVPPQSCSQHSVPHVGKTPGGFICLNSQQEAEQLLFLVPLPSGNEQGCFLDKLGSIFSGLRFSSDSSPVEGPPENKEGQGQGDSDHPEVAGQSVVLNDSGDVDRHSLPASVVAGPPNSVQGSSPQPQAAQLGGMAIKRQRLGKRGFSDKVVETMAGARAQSTITCYETRWKTFSNWCSERDQNPFEADVTAITDFLQLLFDKGRSWSTVKGYVSAISAFHPEYATIPLGSNRDIREFIEGVYKQRPPIKPIVPRWELGMVLQALNDGIFEPPEKASLEAWTMKTVFLVAITSAARVSELQALDSRPELFRIHRYKATLRLNPAFTPKVPWPEYLNREIELEGFYPHGKDHIEKSLHKLCPVRALRYYLDKTKDIRKDPQLFVSYQAGKQGNKVTKATIARWIKNTILFAYRHLGRQIPVSSVKAHSTRAVAASLADVKGVSPADLCAAATWSSSLVFAKHYRLDMSARKSISSQVLSAAVAQRS